MVTSTVQMSRVRSRAGVTCLPWERMEEPGKERRLLLWGTRKWGGGRGEEEQGGKQAMGDGLGQELDRALWPLTSAFSQARTSPV